MGKTTMNIFNTQLTLLVAQWLLEVDIRSVRKSYESLNKGKKHLKTTRTWINVLEKHEKIKLKETMHLKNENIIKKKETLKVWNATKIIAFLKNSIWFSFIIWVQFCFSVMIILGPRGGGDDSHLVPITRSEPSSSKSTPNPTLGPKFN